jgi:glycosyltransferase involved in cell wall biosynthesis
MSFDYLSNNEELRTLIVIPLFNNRHSICQVVKASLRTGFDVLVVDDGSTDSGIDEISNFPIKILRHDKNRGKGAALKTAVAWAGKKAYTHIITIDADGQHNPAEAVMFEVAINKAPRSIIVGERKFDGQDVPLTSRIGKIKSNFWLKIITGTNPPDSQCGFRAYPVEALSRINCTAQRYDYEIEILARGALSGIKIESIPISVRYSPETRKNSNFHLLKDNFRCAWTFARLLFEYTLSRASRDIDLKA